MTVSTSAMEPVKKWQFDTSGRISGPIVKDGKWLYVSCEDAKLYNEFHALLVRVGKERCRPKVRCEGCPLESLSHWVQQEW